MKIRRFYSKNMRNALKQVTEEFGNDAAILSSQKTPSGVEVIAALDYDEELLPESISGLGKSKIEVKSNRLAIDSDINDINTYANNEQHSIGTNMPNEANISHLEERFTQNSQENRINEPYETIIDERKMANNASNNSGYYNTDPVSVDDTNSSVSDRTFANSSKLEWSTDPGLIGMKEELGLMRSMMKEQLDGIGWQRLTERDPITAMLNRRLSSLGVSQSVINRLLPSSTNINSGNSNLNAAARHVVERNINELAKQSIESSNQDPECCWQKTLALLAKSIPIDVTNIIANGGTLAFMGPSGAGKTTTIAKLAARYVIKHGANSVGLITTDNYRAAGRLQLQSFAKLLKVPVAQVTDKHSLGKLIDGFGDKKLILIDTPSINSNDIKSVNNLECIQHYCQNNPHRKIKKLLLLPATHQQAALQQTVNTYSEFSPDSCIITKLDEAVSLGEVISLLIENSLPVAYTTDGQKVPENIRVARNHHLVSKAVWLSNRQMPNKQMKQERKPRVTEVKTRKQPMQAVS